MASNYLYIQKVEVHNDMVELYQQFLLKLRNAYQSLNIESRWTVYEDVFKPRYSTQEFIFIRPMESWSKLDEFSMEEGISEIMAKAYDDKEALQWMKIVQKSVKKITTSVLSKMKPYS